MKLEVIYINENRAYFLRKNDKGNGNISNNLTSYFSRIFPITKVPIILDKKKRENVKLQWLCR